jgi:hypothetical protein
MQQPLSLLAKIRQKVLWILVSSLFSKGNHNEIKLVQTFNLWLDGKTGFCIGTPCQLIILLSFLHIVYCNIYRMANPSLAFRRTIKYEKNFSTLFSTEQPPLKIGV